MTELTLRERQTIARIAVTTPCFGPFGNMTLNEFIDFKLAARDLVRDARGIGDGLRRLDKRLSG